METLWFCLVAVMISGYVVFDGFDLGAGIIHLHVARTPQERAQVLRTIGPVWDGNEVWLIAAGGTLFFAFPTLYASSFSGFYLPLMIVLWLLILRGIALEFRHPRRPGRRRPGRTGKNDRGGERPCGRNTQAGRSLSTRTRNAWGSPWCRNR